MIYIIFYCIAAYLFVGILAFFKLNKDGMYEQFVIDSMKNDPSVADVPLSFAIKAGCVIVVLTWPRWILDLI